MGANAQTTVPTFTAAQVLTADQMNQSARTGVPVFADSTARDAGFGGAGEKTLAEGQLCYLESTNVVQYYDGAVWATVGPATPGALTLISATTIGSAVSTVTVSSAFSSTYDNYLITISGGVASTTNQLIMQLGATTTNYTRTIVFMTQGSATVSGANDTEWRVGGGTTDSLNGWATLFGPNLAKRTVLHTMWQQPVNNGVGMISWGVLSDSTQYTAFTISLSGGTITGGTIRVYGYANS